jgi:phosphatidylglycerol---prolipoprotein diacylglyceryl transferase
MDPIMFTLGPLTVRWYGVFIALGVLVGAIWGLREGKRRGLDGEWLLDVAPWLVVAGIIGARFIYVLTSPSAFFGANGDPIRALYVWEGGISIHGAVVAIVAVLVLLARRKRYDPWAYFDLLTPIAALGIIGGRLGNFMNGTDTGGRLTNWGIGFSWPDAGTATWGALGRVLFGDPLWLYAPPVCRTIPFGDPCVVHLTPAYGGLVGVLLALMLWWGLPRWRVPGVAFLQFILWYSVLRSLIEEPFRDNPLLPELFVNDAAGIGLLTLTQLFSLPIIALAWVYLQRRKNLKGLPRT